MARTMKAIGKVANANTGFGDHKIGTKNIVENGWMEGNRVKGF